MSSFVSEPDSLSMGALSVVLVGPDEEQRRAMAKALAGPQATVAREFSKYPEVSQLPDLTAGNYDVIIVHLDPDPEPALDVVESLCSGNSTVTVMVHSTRPDPQLLIRCMRAGAREFLTDPLLPNVVGEALVRAAVRRGEVHRKKVPLGKLFVFAGAKGGAGVTTVASSFAVSLAPHAKVALLDLDLQLGDAALSLGMSTKFTTLDALGNLPRLDSDFLMSLMAKHDSGLWVLAAPDTIPAKDPPRDGIGWLLRIVREEFEYVVIDAGSHSFDWYEELFNAATTVYLVSQVSVPDLRNANRFVTRYFGGANRHKLEIVLNRDVAQSAEIDNAAVTKALTTAPKWHVPNDYAAARRAQNTGVAVALEKSRLAQALRQMANTARGAKVKPQAKKILGIF